MEYIKSFFGGVIVGLFVILYYLFICFLIYTGYDYVLGELYPLTYLKVCVLVFIVNVIRKLSF